MDDEWDLHAVVRSCTTISTDHATATSDSTNTTSNTTIDIYDELFDDIKPFSCLNYGENPYQGLEEVYKEGCSHRPTVETTLGTVTDDVSVDDDEQVNMLDVSTDSFANETPSKKRKNQQKKTVVELRQEDLSSDTWAWRKYGQKPIKGSPFPRNYYKCSTTKACGARKQVEQSHMDPTIFIVSYSGEHIHPRPTHRSPLAGSTRSNKFATANQLPISDNTTANS